MSNNNNGGAKFAVGLLIGTAIGAAAALLTAPKSGEENRKLLKDKMDDAKKKVDYLELDKKVKAIIPEGDQLYSQAEERVRQQLDQLKKQKEKIDEKKYLAIVDSTLKSMKGKSDDMKDKMDELRSKLKNNSDLILSDIRRAGDDMKQTVN